MYPHKGAFPPMGGPSNLASSNLPTNVGENQWMSQSAYQNIDLDKVDWAALAQQWIHMKESTGSVESNGPIPNAPPPPRFSHTITDYEEQGEAPMEVEHEDEQTSHANETTVNVTAPPAPTNIFNQSNNWSNSQSNSRGSHPKQWNKKGNRWNSHKSQRSQNAASGQVFNNAKQAWSAGGGSSNTSLPAHANQSSELKMHGLDANPKSGIQLEQIGLNATPALDAVQRKTLPAWIREGLEKMEREKQRQADRDREMKERDEKRRQEKLIEQNLLMQLNANESSPKLPAKSKFESDSDSDNDETVNSDYSENIPNAKIASERTTVGSMTSASTNQATSSAPTTVPTVFKPHRTKAEILTEIMLSVRKNLTEILLEVTNEEIYAIAQDTLSKVRTKGRKAQSVQKNAFTANSTALGLVVYDDSDASKSGDESDLDDERPYDHKASDYDSDLELKRSIQRRKTSFENKSIEIESYLADLEEREKQWLENDETVKSSEELAKSPSKSPHSQLPIPTANSQLTNNENNEIERDTQKLPNISKSERKNSRFSDAKTLMYNVANSQVAASATSTHIRPSVPEHKSSESKKHDRDRKEAHSDDSDSSRKRTKHSSSKSSHHRGKRDRSRSPSSRRHKKSSRRRSSSSSSDRSSYSRHSDSRHSDRSRKHSRRDRSSSDDDRTSKSSQSSRDKRDKHSREKSYSRSHSYKRSRH